MQRLGKATRKCAVILCKSYSRDSPEQLKEFVIKYYKKPYVSTIHDARHQPTLHFS